MNYDEDGNLDRFDESPPCGCCPCCGCTCHPEDDEDESQDYTL